MSKNLFLYQYLETEKKVPSYFFKYNKSIGGERYGNDKLIDKYDKKGKIRTIHEENVISFLEYIDFSTINLFHKKDRISLFDLFSKNNESYFILKDRACKFSDIINTIVKSNDSIEKVTKNSQQAFQDLRVIIMNMITHNLNEDKDFYLCLEDAVGETRQYSVDEVLQHHLKIENIASNFKVTAIDDFNEYQEDTSTEHQWIKDKIRFDEKLKQYNFLNVGDINYEDDYDEVFGKPGKIHLINHCFGEEVFFIFETGEWKYFLPIEFLEEVSNIEVITK